MLISLEIFSNFEGYRKRCLYLLVDRNTQARELAGGLCD